MASWANLKRDMRRVAKKKKAKYTPKKIKPLKAEVK
jgi:hypothetical protein